MASNHKDKVNLNWLGNLEAISRMKQGRRSSIREKAPHLLKARAALATDQDAADYACVLLSTVQRWLEDGKKEWQAYDEELTDFITDRAMFYVAWKTVKAGKKVELLENIIASSQDPRFWAGAMTLLERSDPENFGRRQMVAIDTDITVRYELHELDGDDWRQRQLRAAETMAADYEPDVEYAKIEA